MKTIAIVEDNAEYRQAIALYLNTLPDMAVTDTYATAEDALTGIEERLVDIAIVDLHLAEMDGITLISRLSVSCPALKFLVCSVQDDNNAVFEALRAGADGYILKSASLAEIAGAIEELIRGGAPMSAFIARKVLSYFHAAPPLTENGELSMREKEILRLLSKGLLGKEIAELLGIQKETVKKHLANIYRKMQVKNRMEAVNKYLGR